MTRHLALLAVFSACGPSSGSSSSGNAASPSTTAAAPQEQGAGAMERAPRTAAEASPDLIEPSPPELESWASVQAAYLSDEGFRYAALKSDEDAMTALSQAVASVGAAEGFADWSRDERLAFLINAYNILTVHAVAERWPIESVMNVDGFFDGIEHQVAGESMTLNVLENERIRPVFGEPRIHFAVNCASTSCPPLRNEPFTAEGLETQLEEQARTFIRATTTIAPRRATLSKLFEWFADDFAVGGGVRAFIAERLDDEDAVTIRNDQTRLRYADYDWSPNSAE